jgi:hypothetical protein
VGTSTGALILIDYTPAANANSNNERPRVLERFALYTAAKPLHVLKFNASGTLLTTAARHDPKLFLLDVRMNTGGPRAAQTLANPRAQRLQHTTIVSHSDDDSKYQPGFYVLGYTTAYTDEPTVSANYEVVCVDCLDFVSMGKGMSTRVVVGVHSVHSWEQVLLKQVQSELPITTESVVTTAKPGLSTAAAVVTTFLGSPNTNLTHHNVLVASCQQSLAVPRPPNAHLTCSTIEPDFCNYAQNGANSKHRKIKYKKLKI